MANNNNTQEQVWRSFWSGFMHRLPMELPSSVLMSLQIAFSLHGCTTVRDLIVNLDSRAFFTGVNRLTNVYKFLAVIESQYRYLDVVIELRRAADQILKGGGASSYEVAGPVIVTNTMMFNNVPAEMIPTATAAVKRRMISALSLFTDDTYAICRLGFVEADAYEDLRTKDLPKLQVIKYMRGKERALAAMNEELDRDIGEGPEDAVAHEYVLIRCDLNKEVVAAPEARKIKNRVKQRLEPAVAVSTTLTKQ